MQDDKLTTDGKTKPAWNLRKEVKGGGGGGGGGSGMTECQGPAAAALPN